MATGEEEHDLYADHSIAGAKAVATLVLGLGSFALAVLPAKMSRWWCPKGGRRLQQPRDQHRGCNDDRHDHHDHQPRHQHHAEHRHAGESAVADSELTSLLVLFGGGVLLFTSVMHLLAEVREGAEVLRLAGRLPGAGVENLVDMVYCAGSY